MAEEEMKESDFEHQSCPLCGEKTLILTERDTEVPYFGKVYMFSMTCNSCKYHKADIEATVKLPHIASITPGPAAQGYVTNVEGILNRVKYQVEVARDSEEDETEKKKAKNLLKKLLNITWGKEKQKLIIEDPSGNSAIISDKAIKSQLKVKKEE